jgi:hypothetical protein
MARNVNIDDINAEFASIPQAGQSRSSYAPANTGEPLDDITAEFASIPQAGGGTYAAAPRYSADLETNKIWSGNWLSDVIDTISLPQYNLMKLLTGKGAKGLYGERYAPSDWLNEKVWNKNTNPFLRGVANLASDIVVDPLNLAALPVKAGVEGAKAFTVGDKAWEGLGKLYKAAGSVGPIEHYAAKLATNPVVHWLTNEGGLTLDRLTRKTRGTYRPLQRAAQEDIDRQMSHIARAIDQVGIGQDPAMRDIVGHLTNVLEDETLDADRRIATIEKLTPKAQKAQQRAESFLAAAGERPPESTIVRDMARWDVHHNAEARPAEIVRGLLGNAETDSEGYVELAAEMLDKAKTKAKGFLDYGGSQAPDYYRTLPFGEKDARPLNRVLQIYRSAAASNMDVAEMLRKQLPSLEKREARFYKKWGATRPTESIPLGEVGRGYAKAYKAEVMPAIGLTRKLEKMEAELPDLAMLANNKALAREAMLSEGSDYFEAMIRPGALAAGKDPVEYAKEAKAAYDKFMEIDRGVSDLAFKLGIFGDVNTVGAQVRRDTWEGTHLKHLYALMGQPELIKEYVEKKMPSLLHYAGDLLRGGEEAYEARNILDLDNAKALLEGKIDNSLGRDKQLDALKDLAKGDGEVADAAFTEYAERVIRSRTEDLTAEEFAKVNANPGLRNGPLAIRFKLGRVPMDKLTMKILGSVTDAVDRISIGAKEVHTANVMEDLLADIAKNTDLVKDAPGPGLIGIAVSGWKDGKPIIDGRAAETWGALAGHFINETLYHDIVNMTKPLPEWVHGMAKWMMPLEWKKWRTTRNPAVFVGNIFGNGILAHMVGNLAPWRASRWAQAFREAFDPLVMDAPDVPAHLLKLRSYVGAELSTNTSVRQKIVDILGKQPPTTAIGKAREGLELSKAWKALKLVGEHADNAYGMAEVISKHAVYLEEMDRLARAGIRGPEAVKTAEALAEKALFDYSDVPRAVDMLRRSGVMPFITFAYKAIPVMIEASVKNPQRLALYARKLEHNIEALDPEYREKKEAEAALVPEYMRGTTSARFPVGAAGEGKWLDFSRYLPVSFDRYLPSSNQPGGPLQSIPAGIIGNLGAAPKALIELGMNQRTVGSHIPVVGEGEAILPAAGQYALEQFAPPLLPGGTTANQIKRALFDPTNAASTGQAELRATVGLNIYDIERQRRHKAAMK